MWGLGWGCGGDFQQVVGIISLGRVGLEQVGALSGGRGEADVKVLDGRADYWVAKWEL